jgi:hypothetical protein
MFSLKPKIFFKRGSTQKTKHPYNCSSFFLFYINHCSVPLQTDKKMQYNNNGMVMLDIRCKITQKVWAMIQKSTHDIKRPNV